MTLLDDADLRGKTTAQQTGLFEGAMAEPIKVPSNIGAARR